jgi:glycosyltransferase involved in cell wall biosynthesis
MPVYNALPHLDAAVESILAQTFTDFEFVILDDASTDGSRERLRQWASRDFRIRLLKVDENLGPVGSSNMVAHAARAPLVARMDADDISHPERLNEEIELLRGHPDAGIVASLCDMIDRSGRKMRDAEIWRLARRSAFVPFAHGAMMYRRAIFEQVGGYREECEFWEDQDLVMRMGRISKVLVIPRALYRVRQSTTSTRVASSPELLERALNREYRAIDRLELGKTYDEHPPRAENDSRSLDPRVFIAIGSVRLWAGRNPRLFQRCLTRADISWNLRSAFTLIWTAWASANPRSLRWFLLILLRARNRLALGRLPSATAFTWQPLEQVRDLEEPAR